MSSLFPEFEQPHRYGVDSSISGGRPLTVETLLSSDWMDDERADLLTVVRRELSGTPRASGNSSTVGKPLDVVLAELIDEASPMTHFVSGCPDPVQSIWTELLDGFTALGPSRVGAFDQRSRIHRDTAWPGDTEQRSAEQILGSREHLELLREFLDTLYNKVVARSIGGTMRAQFTTGMVHGDRPLAGRAIAQELAIAGFGLAHGEQVRPIAWRNETQAGFELLTSAEVDNSLNQAELSGVRQLRHDLSAGLPELFVLRAAQSPSGLTSSFWQRIERIERASGADTANEMLNEHLAEVWRALGRGGGTGNLSEFRQMAIEATVGLPLWGATVRWESSASWLGGLGAVLSIATPTAVRHAKSGLDQRRRVRRISHAFGSATGV